MSEQGALSGAVQKALREENWGYGAHSWAEKCQRGCTCVEKVGPGGLPELKQKWLGGLSNCAANLDVPEVV